MKFKIKTGYNPLGVKAAYIFGITVCISSVYLSGFEENPLKDRKNFSLNFETNKNEGG